MSNQQRSLFSPGMIVGLVIILIGVLALLANLGFDVNIHLWDYWPVILILIGLSMLLKSPENRNTLAGSLFLIFGALFLLNNFEIIDFRFNLLWPIAIILIGFSILRHGFHNNDVSDNPRDRIDISAILGGGEHNFTTKSFKGGRVFAFMGGTKIDLREAEMEDDSATINVFAMMGGVDFLVPSSWQVTVKGMPFLGGIDNKTSGGAAEGGGQAGKNLIIDGTAIMGGIEVKN